MADATDSVTINYASKEEMCGDISVSVTGEIKRNAEWSTYLSMLAWCGDRGYLKDVICMKGGDDYVQSYGISRKGDEYTKTEYVDLSGEDYNILNLSSNIDEIVSVEVATPVFHFNEAGWAVTDYSRGDELSHKCEILSHSCIFVDLDEKLYGTLKVTYNPGPYAKEFIWNFGAYDYGTFYFYFYHTTDGRLDEYQLTIEPPEDTTSSQKNITMKVIDHGTYTGISNASVYIDNNYEGKTDEDGYITIEGITTGDHELLVTADGYINTDEDVLANDSFHVD